MIFELLKVENMNNAHRVRTLLRYLNYSTLKKSKTIPTQAMFTATDVQQLGGKFPKLAKEMGYSSFGLFMEQIIDTSLTNRSAKVEDVMTLLKRGIPPPFNKLFVPSDYVAIGNMVRHHFEDMPEQQVEWERGPIQGHPDLVYRDCVYDIKTTGRFGAMRSDTILQLLSYYCLAQLTYTDGRVKKIGLVLPAQRQIITVDLGDWEWEPFWEELKGVVKTKLEREALYITDSHSMMIFQTSLKVFVGTHVDKPQLLKYIAGFHRPLQFFVGGRSNTNVTITDTFRKDLKDEINNSTSPVFGKVPVFIHSPYTLNLSNPWGDNHRPSDKSTIPWTCERLIYLLKLGQECGLRGIVVHTGQCRTTTKKIKDSSGKVIKTIPPMEMSTALINMFTSVNIVAKHATESCPLLIETSAGEKAEILDNRDEFISFFMALPNHIKPKVKMCVDTCHVLAAGYHPDEYIREVHASGVPIGLIHYNDSFHPIGSRIDSHAPPGEGFVGFESLANSLSHAVEHNIPCVRE